MSARGRGLQIEIVASLLVVWVAGFVLFGAVLASVMLRSAQESRLRELGLVASHVEWAARNTSLRASEVAIVAQTLDAPGSGAEWSFVDVDGRPLGLASAGTPHWDESDGLRTLVDRAWRSGRASDGRGLPLRDIAVARVVAVGDGRSGILVGAVDRERWLDGLVPVGRVGVSLITIAALCFVAFASYTLRRRIVRPLQLLGAATERVAAGDFDVRAELGGSHEIVELGRSFNDMAASLREQRTAVLSAHESLGRSQRLATVGQLAAGVAHEVGNPVAAVLGYAEVVVRDPDASERSRDAALRIRAEALRVRELVRELLDLARADRLRVAPCAPAALLERLRAWLEPQKLLDGVALELDTADGLPPVHIDTRKVEQALINLVENAAHALSSAKQDGEDGETTPPDDRREPRIVVRALAGPEDGFVTISVEDNGPGIAPDDLPAIFDPFFTTKDPGSGTGLGLWNAHRIAELLGGRLEVTTRPGCTRFSLILPAADTNGAHG